MGASQSGHGNAVQEKLVDLPLPGEEPLLDLPAPPKDDDEPLLELSKMKRRACSVDPKLSANPRRKAPPINPKTCKEGSVAMGKDGEFYVIKSGKWMKVSKRLDEKNKEQIRERLSGFVNRTENARKNVAAKKSKTVQTPKRRSVKKSVKKSSKKGRAMPKAARVPKKRSSKKSSKKAESPKRGRGRPKGSKNKKSSSK